MLNFINPIMSIIEKVIPDKEKQQQIKLALIVNENSLQQSKVQLIGKLIEKGCIPALFWMFILIMFNNMILSRYVEFFTNKAFPILEMDENYVDLLKVITGFLFGKKTFEKFKK